MLGLVLSISASFLGCVTSPVPPPPEESPVTALNFVVIDIDSLRFDRAMDPALAPNIAARIGQWCSYLPVA